MKKLSIVFMALAFSQLASAVSLEQLAGSYKISHAKLPLTNIVKIAENGEVSLTEISLEGEIECLGQGKLSKKNIFSSSLKCKNGLTFTQKINLNEVKNLTKFKAKVFSSLYEQEIEMDIERL